MIVTLFCRTCGRYVRLEWSKYPDHVQAYQYDCTACRRARQC